MKIDLNADLGEGMEGDADLLAIVSSCNIACGGHAGDAESMRRTLTEAARRGVACGAHPSYPDREGFGRRAFEGPADALAKTLRLQIEALVRIADEEGVRLTHVKPHGRLYNDAARDAALARLIVKVAAEAAPGAALVGPPGSRLAEAAKAEDLAFIVEGFADRGYDADGLLLPRGEDGALITDHEAQAAQAVVLAAGEPFTTPRGGSLTLRAETLCLHGDTPGALAAAKAVRAALEARGYRIEAPYG